MGDRRSKEDDLQKISTSIFVTNFPEQSNAKELWSICKQYGNVIDAFIPNRRSKIGKRFGFIRFIKVTDVDRLVNNLCTIWIGSFKLHANVARFNRLPSNKGSHDVNPNVKVRIPPVDTSNRGGINGAYNSYIQAFKTGSSPQAVGEDSKPSMVLDHSCFNDFDFNLSLVGKLIEFDSLPNIKKLLEEEGFADITFRYMGGFWILKESLYVFGLGILLRKSPLNGEYFWIRAKEVTGWAPKFSNSHDDSSDLDVGSEDANDNGLPMNCKADIHSEDEDVPETIFEDGEIKSSDFKENPNEVQQEAQSEDPFHIYDLLKTKQTAPNVTFQFEEEPKYPPGFTPRGNSVNYECGEDQNEPPEKNCGEDLNVSPEKENGTKFCFKDDASASVCSGPFKKVGSSKTGGFILQLIEDLIKVGQTMGYKMEGCLAQKAKKDWVKELCRINKVNFLTLQETKMEQVSLFDIKSCWGNPTFDFVVSTSVGNSGGILCVWDINMFNKENVTVSDYFIATMGKWLPSDKKLLVISVYAPQELSEKKMLWSYLNQLIDGWKGDVIVMSDFNEVRSADERFGSIFNARGATILNSFIASGGLVEGFDSFMADTWKNTYILEPNAMLKLIKKLKLLKGSIRTWVNDRKDRSQYFKKSLKHKLSVIDSSLDKGEATSAMLEDRLNIMNDIKALENNDSLELAQKAKIKWAIEGDENSKFFYGIINKHQNNLSVRGIIIDEEWIEEPRGVKTEFFSHFRDRFDHPHESRLTLDMNFPNKLSIDQALQSKRPFTVEEIKGAVWGCGSNKSPGPDGFTFEFYRRYWGLIEDEVVVAVNYFFHNGFVPKGGNSSFIALIPKIPGAKMVKDFRPISLIGSLYKIIAKLLANRLVTVMSDLVNELQSAFIANRQILDGPFMLNEIIHWCKAKKKQTMIFKVDFEKAFDSIRWDFLDDVLTKFGFGTWWRDWIQSCLKSSRGSILINGNPTSEFQFYKGLKHGDPLSPFLFILISHFFYADDVVFVSQWCDSNLSTIIRVLECFFLASGLRINLHKSKLIGIAVEQSMVDAVASNIGCMALNLPFLYIGITICGNMSRINAWDSVINKVVCIHFFNGVEPNVQKMSFVKWDNVLASKEKGGLGISSYFALNRALTFKWIWRFRCQDSSLWSKVIKSIHGEDGKISNIFKHGTMSNWNNITRGVTLLHSKGIDLLGYIKKKTGNDESTLFWNETWKGDVPFNLLYPRIYALETYKTITVANKMAHSSLAYSLRRIPRGSIEQRQMDNLMSNLEGYILPNMHDRWRWSLSGDGNFSVASVRNLIDDKILDVMGSKTRWNKSVPIKINILAWRLKLDKLPSRLNLSRRGLELDSTTCPSCTLAVESTNHIFFGCSMAKDLYKFIARWWDVSMPTVSSYDEWWNWFFNLRVTSKIKMLVEGVFYIVWWVIWKFRNNVIFGLGNQPKDRLLDDIVSLSFTWCKSRCKAKFNWEDWLKNPSFISL
ncbi:RNA-directed DNA polymerase, eukaryota [Tanacetum coccineum]